MYVGGLVWLDVGGFVVVVSGCVIGGVRWWGKFGTRRDASGDHVIKPAQPHSRCMLVPRDCIPS
jgi:hypothetical protein